MHYKNTKPPQAALNKNLLLPGHLVKYCMWAGTFLCMLTKQSAHVVLGASVILILQACCYAFQVLSLITCQRSLQRRNPAIIYHKLTSVKQLSESLRWNSSTQLETRQGFKYFKSGVTNVIIFFHKSAGGGVCGGKHYMNSKHLQGRLWGGRLCFQFSILFCTLVESVCFCTASRTTRAAAATAMKFQALVFLLLLTWFRVNWSDVVLRERAQYENNSVGNDQKTQLGYVRFCFPIWEIPNPITQTKVR